MQNNFRGWEVEFENGTLMNEDQAPWSKVPKTGIVRLSLFYDGRQWNILNKDFYFQKKHASMVPGIPETFRIESRTIGYYEGKTKVMYTVNEETGVMNLEVRDIE